MRTSVLIRIGCAVLLSACVAVAVSTRTARDGPPAMHQALRDLQSGRAAEAEAAALQVAMAGAEGGQRAWLVVADARQRQNQYAAAVRAYRMYLASCDSAEMRRYVMDRMAQCRIALSPPAPHVPLARRLTPLQRKELARVDTEMFVESSDHFVIRAKNAKLARLLAVEGEQHLERIRRDVLGGQDYPHSVELWVWPTHAEYLKHATDAQEWSGGSFRLIAEDGVLTRRIDLTQLDASGELSLTMLDRVLPHEMCHLVIRELFGDAECPLFLDEGLAMLAETEIDSARVDLAAAALGGKQRIALGDLLARQRHHKGNVEAFYAESLSFTRFLRARLTRQQFRSFLSHVKDGSPVTEALHRALYLQHNDALLPALATAWEDRAQAEAQILRALRNAN